MTEDKVLSIYRPFGRSQEIGSDLAADARASQHAAWIEVIRKMDETYPDLVRYQIDMEEKNGSLEAAQPLILSVLASMTDVLIVCDAKDRIQEVNKAMEAPAGESEANLKGDRFRSFSPVTAIRWDYRKHKYRVRLNSALRSRPPLPRQATPQPFLPRQIHGPA